MKNKALFSSKYNSKKLKCRLLQFLFGALRVKHYIDELGISHDGFKDSFDTYIYFRKSGRTKTNYEMNDYQM